MLEDDDDDMPHVWNVKDTSDLEDDQDNPSNPRRSQESIHKSSKGHDISEDQYAEKLASARKMMDDTNSFEQDSKSDVSRLIKDSKNVSKLTDRSKLSNKEKAPQPKLNKKYDADDAVEFSDEDDDDDVMSDDYAEKVKEIKSIGKKQISEEWDPRKEQNFTDKLIELYLKDKSQLTNDEKRLAEQQLMLKKHYSGNMTKSFRSSSGETESLKKPSPVMEKTKSKVQKKLTVVREITDPSEDIYTPREYTDDRPNDPEPKFDSKGKLKFDFQDQELPELDVDTLAKIRDQLLLQKMYENDLEKFKKFKKTKGKKGKSKARGRDNIRNCKYNLLIV